MIEQSHTNQENQYIGNYRLLQLLTQTETSEIYLCEHGQNSKPLVLKKMYGRWFGDDLAKFFAHASTLSRLQHPHIIPILDFGADDDIVYMIMQYSSNGTLRERHPKGAIVPPSTVVHYVKQIASALQYTHDHKLIHRDIKPHNMLIGNYGEILLSDFGSSVVSHSLNPLYPSQYDFEGTVVYSAPEQLRGTPRRSSDQYALGVVTYEWLCGQWPFVGTFEELTHQHLFVSPPPLRTKNPDLHPAIEQTVMKTLAKDVEKRFPSVTEFAEALQWSVEQSQPTAPSKEKVKRQFMSPKPFTDDN